jgi:NitT/TauT family transport system ATP-binding protein
METLAASGNVKLNLRSVSKVFDGHAGPLLALADIDLEVGNGEFLCIVGPSGCGKTTLLRIIAGLESISTGRVEAYHENPAHPINTMVFQEQSVFPWLTVQDNVEYGLRARGVPHVERSKVAAFYIERLGLNGFAKAFPRQLSGGMKQRVSIGRAFANDPEILLMDEPFASLDEQTKLILQDQLLKIWEETRKTVVFITHSLEEAVALGDRVIVMSARPGRIRAEYTIDLQRPRSVLALKEDRRFAELVAEVWRVLREEVLAANSYANSRTA